MGKKLSIQVKHREWLDVDVIKNSRSIADSMKKRVLLMEEKKATLTFSESNYETKEETADKEEFFRLKRKGFLKLSLEVGELDDDYGTKKPRTFPNTNAESYLERQHE